MYNEQNAHIIEVTVKEKNVLIDLALQINANPSDNPELFCIQSKECSHNVPQRIKNILKDFAENGTKTGFLLIKNITFDDIDSKSSFPISIILPKTPENNNNKIGETTVLARIQSILINVISEMISYEAEGYGRLFQDIIPIKKIFESIYLRKTKSRIHIRFYSPKRNQSILHWL